MTRAGISVRGMVVIVALALPFAMPDQAAAQCQSEVKFGIIEAQADCFRREGEWYVSDGRVRVNGMTFNPLAGRPLRISPNRRALSLGTIQLRVGSIVLYQGELEYTVPAGDRVTLARIDLASHSRVDSPPEDPEAGLDLDGEDSAHVQGLELEGEVKLELAQGRTILTGTVGLPGAFTDAEGRGLTGRLELTADNVRGIHLSGIELRAARAFIGQLELEDLFVTFAGETNSDATQTCNAETPGLRWEGGARAIVVPTPEPLRLQDVALGLADGRFSYARASWLPPFPGREIGGGVRVQRIGISLCMGPPVRLEGTVALNALPDGDGTPALEIPDATLRFEAGNPWTLEAEAPAASLSRAGWRYEFSDLAVRYRSSGLLEFRGGVDFRLPVTGAIPLGPLDAAVTVKARADGFVDGARFNADLSAKGCFAGTLRIREIPVPIGDDDSLCVTVDGVLSSVGVAVCGQVPLRGDTFALGGGYHWGADATFISGRCDLSPWRAARIARVSAGGARLLEVRGRQRGVLVAMQGPRAPVLELRGPRGEMLRTAADPRRATRKPWAVAFAHVDSRTTYVLLARPSRGTWTVAPRAGTRISSVRTADVLPHPRIDARLLGRGGRRLLTYRVRPLAGQRVIFEDRSAAGSRTLAIVHDGGAGHMPFTPRRATTRHHRIIATVEQGGVPRRRIQFASFDAPRIPPPGRPRRVSVRADRTRISVAWSPATRTRRYAVRVTLPDGRRLLYVRPSTAHDLRLPRPDRGGRVAVRVVGLDAHNAPGAAAVAATRLPRQDR